VAKGLRPAVFVNDHYTLLNALHGSEHGTMPNLLPAATAEQPSGRRSHDRQRTRRDFAVVDKPSSSATLPVDVEVNRQQRTMTITWSDGGQTRYSWSVLRRCCPCATCGAQRAEAQRDPLRVIGPDAAPVSDELVDVRPIGSYALQLEFADGHSSGFYTWEHFRRLPTQEAGETQ